MYNVLYIANYFKTVRWGCVAVAFIFSNLLKTSSVAATYIVCNNHFSIVPKVAVVYIFTVFAKWCTLCSSNDWKMFEFEINPRIRKCYMYKHRPYSHLPVEGAVGIAIVQLALQRSLSQQLKQSVSLLFFPWAFSSANDCLTVSHGCVYSIELKYM